MRILLVSHRFPPTGVAGVERITQSLAAELARGGDEVSVLARAPTSPDEPEGPVEVQRQVLADGTTVYRLTGRREWGQQFLAHHEAIERQFVRVMIEAAPDVVHILHLQDLSPRLAESAHRHGAAVVCSLQDFHYACSLVHLLKPNGDLCNGPRGGRECAATCFAADGAHASRRWGLRTLYFRRILDLAQRFVVPSIYVAKFFERYGLDPARLELIPNAVFFPVPTPRATQRPTPRERGCLNLAFLGSIIPHKGLHVLLHALGLARLGPASLLVLGRTHGAEYAARLRRDAAAIPDLTLDWHGEYEPSELPRLLADTDCVVMPSLIRETFGIVIHEAFASGTPALVSNTGAQAELLREGENGFTFDANRPAVLAALLYRLAEDEDLMRKLREGVAQTPVTAADEHARAVRAVYHKALGEPVRATREASVEDEERDSLYAMLLEEGFAIPTQSASSQVR